MSSANYNPLTPFAVDRAGRLAGQQRPRPDMLRRTTLAQGRSSRRPSALKERIRPPCSARTASISASGSGLTAAGSSPGQNARITIRAGADARSRRGLLPRLFQYDRQRRLGLRRGGVQIDQRGGERAQPDRVARDHQACAFGQARRGAPRRHLLARHRAPVRAGRRIRRSLAHQRQQIERQAARDRTGGARLNQQQQRLQLAQQLAARQLDVADAGAHRRRERPGRAVEQKLDIAQHRVERRAQLVTELQPVAGPGRGSGRAVPARTARPVAGAPIEMGLERGAPRPAAASDTPRPWSSGAVGTRFTGSSVSSMIAVACFDAMARPARRGRSEPLSRCRARRLAAAVTWSCNRAKFPLTAR